MQYHRLRVSAVREILYKPRTTRELAFTLDMARTVHTLSMVLRRLRSQGVIDMEWKRWQHVPRFGMWRRQVVWSKNDNTQRWLDQQEEIEAWHS